MQKIILRNRDDRIILERPCLFLGAGVSVLAGYKNWSDLKNELVNKFEIRKKKKEIQNDKLDYSKIEKLREMKDNIEVFDYLESLNNSIYIEEMKSIFKECENKEDTEIYYSLKKLSELRDIFFITTNIDRSFETYLGLRNKHIFIVSDNGSNEPFNGINGTPKKIYYLHGRIDREDTWVFTTNQYNRNYSTEESPCGNFLKYIFENYNVIFIGYGLKELDVLREIFKSRTNKKHYWLEPIYRNRESELYVRATNLKNNYNITLISYDIEENDKTALGDFLDNIYSDSKEGEMNVK